MEILRNIPLKVKAGCRLSLYNGEIEWGHPNRMASIHFYCGKKGDRLVLKDKNYEFAVAGYAKDFDSKYIYTYDYEKNENWTTYSGNPSPAEYYKDEYVFTEEIYFRINLRKADGSDIENNVTESIEEILVWEKPTEYSGKDLEDKVRRIEIFRDELNSTVETVKEKKNNDSIVFLLLTDTHFVVNGIWEETVINMKMVAEQIGVDGTIHLGDCTDGLVSKEITSDYVNGTFKQLNQIAGPLYYTIGNHDTNYFGNNPEKFSIEEAADFYLDRKYAFEESYKDKDSEGNLEDRGEIFRENGKAYYYVDYSTKKLRLIFLDSFDYSETIRYGFSDEELDWFSIIIEKTPADWGVTVFSHVPPLGRLHYWSSEIRGSERLISILKKKNTSGMGKVLGYIHGHNHADQIDMHEGFPIISIGCSKCEYFTDKKPKGAVTYERSLNTVSQELWDVLIISTKKQSLEFVRFGAGENRSVTNCPANYTNYI